MYHNLPNGSRVAGHLGYFQFVNCCSFKTTHNSITKMSVEWEELWRVVHGEESNWGVSSWGLWWPMWARNHKRRQPPGGAVPSQPHTVPPPGRMALAWPASLLPTVMTESLEHIIAPGQGSSKLKSPSNLKQSWKMVRSASCFSYLETLSLETSLVHPKSHSECPHWSQKMLLGSPGVPTHLPALLLEKTEAFTHH
jgi:hypothetical protein